MAETITTPSRNVRTQGSTREAVKEFFAAEARNAERIQKYNLGLSDDEELPPYRHQDYPKAMYPLDGDPIVVAGQLEEQQKLAEGYYSSILEANAAQEAIDDEPAAEEPASEPRVMGGKFAKLAKKGT